MASITKRTRRLDTGRAVTSYQVRVRMKGGDGTITKTFSKLTDAKAFATSTEAAIRERRHFAVRAAERLDIGDVIDDYLNDELPALSASQQNAAGGQLRWWKQELRGLSVADVTPERVDKAIRRLKQPYTTPSGRTKVRTGATINRYASALSAALAGIIRQGVIQQNPAAIKRQPERARVRFLSKEEQSRLLEACAESTSLFLAVSLSLATGARRGEIMSLTWQQIRWRDGGADIHLTKTKNGEARTIRVEGKVADVLRGQVRRIDTNLLFPSAQKPDQPIDLRKQFEKAVRKAGLENFRWHDMRHTAASNFASAGLSDLEIGAVLGHKTLLMVKRYSHLRAEHVTAAAAAASDLMDSLL